MLIEINDVIVKRIKEYCEINNDSDFVAYINKVIKKNFMEDMYGIKPNISINKPIEKDETVVETNKEVVEPVTYVYTGNDKQDNNNDSDHNYEKDVVITKSKKRKLNE